MHQLWQGECISVLACDRLCDTVAHVTLNTYNEFEQVARLVVMTHLTPFLAHAVHTLAA